MSSRAHDKTHFFKYVSFNTALRTITTKSFRWSSPLNFNDPFDHQTGFDMKLNDEIFNSALMKSIEKIIFDEEYMTTPPTTQFGAGLLQLRNIRHRLDKVSILKDLEKTIPEVIANFKTLNSDLNKEITNLLCHSRIFCVSETNDNIVMWSHYAEKHQGVVFKLKCIDEIDNSLLVAKKVFYSNDFVPFPASDEYARHLTEEQLIDMTKLMWDIAYIKHSDWSYEKEWRVHISLLDEPQGDGYSIYTENAAVFESVYLGCRMSQENRQHILIMIRKFLPNIKVFQAIKNDKTFELEFIEIPH